MKTLLKLLEHLGCDITNESWYDEEGVEGTNIVIPNLGEVNVFGWDGNIGFDELMEKVEELFE